MASQQKKEINRLLSVAPMMGYTDRHFRRLIRLISRHVLLYTEMITTNELLHRQGVEHLLQIDPIEHPIALQLGGSDPVNFEKSAKLAYQFGFDEINLNIGCPSARVQAARFGACLMKEPSLVAECVSAIQSVVDLPVTVKTRIGVDDQDQYEQLTGFVEAVAKAGCSVFIVHARKAWLKGLSPKENRHIPPLSYETVYRLKKDFPDLTIILNGGIKSTEEISQHLQHTDGVMLGRALYQQPLWIGELEREYFPDPITEKSEEALLTAYTDYLKTQLALGVSASTLIRHLHGLFQGKPGARHWRRYLHEKTKAQQPDQLSIAEWKGRF